MTPSACFPVPEGPFSPRSFLDRQRPIMGPPEAQIDPPLCSAPYDDDFPCGRLLHRVSPYGHDAPRLRIVIMVLTSFFVRSPGVFLAPVSGFFG